MAAGRRGEEEIMTRRIGYWWRPTKWSSAMPGDAGLTVELDGAEAQELPNMLALMAYGSCVRDARGGNEEDAPLTAGTKSSDALTDKALNPQLAEKVQESQGEALMAAVRGVIADERGGAWE